MRRIHGLALSVILVGCSLDVAPLTTPKVILTPVLDSVFVGDQLVKRQVTAFDDHGNTVDPGTVTWSTADTAVITVDSVTGKITGHGPGVGLLLATAQKAQGFAVIVVSPSLKVTLLVDSIMLMPGDTYTAPVEVVHQAPGVPVVWFSGGGAAATVDSATGLITATAIGGPVPIVAHAALTPDTVADAGTVEIKQLSDTLGGSAYYTIFGTAQRARRVAVRGSIYPRTGGSQTFRLSLPTLEGGTTIEEADIVLRTPPAGPGVFAIDSISPLEAPSQSADPFCSPPRAAWGWWYTLTQATRVDALSRNGGTLTISQIVAVPHGLAISGHFFLPAQRTDRYSDPSGLLPVRGTFVAPVITGPATCN